MPPIIQVEELTKTFRIAKRDRGLVGAFRGLFSRKYETCVAVDQVSFEIPSGELVGYIGANGAGKSTTIKMLTGILVPTSGMVRVAGRVPCKSRIENAQHIGAVFGQRTQLWWDLPLVESFDLLKAVYQIPDERYQENISHFRDLLGLNEFEHVPVRKLSLGQRMRGDLVAAMLHDPDILYLDEPTIGLDLVAKDAIRECIRVVNQQKGTTVILSTHDMGDIEELCQRIMIIDHGRIIYDGTTTDIKERFGKERILVAEITGEVDGHLNGKGALVREEGMRKWIRFDRSRVSAAELVSYLADCCQVRDFSIEEPDIESIVKRIYQEGM